MSAHPIVAEVAAQSGIAVADMVSGSLTPARVAARQIAAYRLWTETDLSTDEIARRIGRRDHAAAIAAILAGARRSGVEAATVSELRGRTAALDWTKLGYAAAGYRAAQDLTIEQAARRAGVGRIEWRKAERGVSIGAATLLKICRTAAIDPFSLLPVSHETGVKHSPARAA